MNNNFSSGQRPLPRALNTVSLLYKTLTQDTFASFWPPPSFEPFYKTLNTVSLSYKSNPRHFCQQTPANTKQPPLFRHPSLFPCLFKLIWPGVHLLWPSVSLLPHSKPFLSHNKRYLWFSWPRIVKVCISWVLLSCRLCNQLNYPFFVTVKS